MYPSAVYMYSYLATLNIYPGTLYMYSYHCQPANKLGVSFSFAPEVSGIYRSLCFQCSNLGRLVTTTDHGYILYCAQSTGVVNIIIGPTADL